MTLIWLFIWLIADRSAIARRCCGTPVNIWAGTLLLAIAVDLGRQHVPSGRGGCPCATG